MSVAVTRISMRPVVGGVPLKVRVVVLNANHAGRTLPSACEAW